ncbi:hypothetical protein [Streptomyces sp. NPDC060184]|uniref:hypothetical protein n=1 Tax=Streptomyces sp. NPDC060184 TaxID=3347064 RepID=UPI00365C24B9
MSNDPTPTTHDEVFAESRRSIQRALGPDWQAGRHEPRDAEAEIITPTLDEMAAAPGATQTKYRVTYIRVGHHGGRDGSPAPAPLTLWTVTADSLLTYIAKDIRSYLLSDDVEVVIDLETMTGSIYAGFRNAGSFTLEALQVAEGGAA